MDDAGMASLGQPITKPRCQVPQNRKLARARRNNTLIHKQLNKRFISNSITGQVFTKGERCSIACCAVCLRASGAVFVVVSVVLFVVPYIGTCGFFTFECAVSSLSNVRFPYF